MRRILLATLLVATHLASAQVSQLFLGSGIFITSTVADSSNNLYLAGYFGGPAGQGDVPTTPGSYQPIEPGCSGNTSCGHGFVAKISNSGALVFATYIGDSANQEGISAIAVDSAGNVFIASQRSPLSATGSGAPFGSVQKISSDGSKLLASYKLAGGLPSAIAISTSGDVYVTGQVPNQPTCGCPFVATPGAFQTTAQGAADAFVVRLTSSLELVYSTFVGGSGADSGHSIAVDAAGNAYITGSTANPASFPTTATGYVQPGSAAIDEEVFVAKLNASGSQLIFSALLDASTAGGSVGGALAIDDTGVYVAGTTTSTNVPESQNAFFRTGGAFLAKLAPDGSALIYQTLLPGRGGTTIPSPFAIAVDTAGNPLILSVASFTNSVGTPPVPTTRDAFAPCTRSQIDPTFVMSFNSTGTWPTYSSYLPGGLAIRGDGRVWYWDSWGAVNSFNVHDALPTAVRCVADQITGVTGPIAPGKLVKLIGLGIGPDTPQTMQLDSTGKVSVGLGGVNVYFNGIAAPLMAASANEIDAVVPFENLDPKEFPTATVAILKNGVEIDGAPVPVAATAPVIYTDPQNCLTAFNQDGTLNNKTHPAALGSLVYVFGEGAGQMNPAITGGIGNGQSQLLAPVTAELNDPTVGFPGGGFPVTSPAKIVYAGDVPGYIEGVFQLQVLLPKTFDNPGTASEGLRIFFGSTQVANDCIWVKPAN